MRHRKLLAALSVGALTVVGGMAAGPGNGQGEGPPDEAENACPGIEEAQDRVPEDSHAAEVLEEVEAMLAGECDEGKASDQKGDNGDRGPGNGED
jgi:hypothetical protein